MKKFHLGCFVLLLAVTTAGCGVPIKYGFDKSMYRRAEPKNLTAVVDLFQDLRTEDEHNGTEVDRSEDEVGDPVSDALAGLVAEKTEEWRHRFPQKKHHEKPEGDPAAVVVEDGVEIVHRGKPGLKCWGANLTGKVLLGKCRI
jgi:hypothetical protein